MSAIEPFEVIVDDALADERLDRALARLIEEVSRGRVLQWIKGGYVNVSSLHGTHIKGVPQGGAKPATDQAPAVACKPSIKLKTGYRIECTPPPLPTATLTPQDVPFDIHYQDQHLAVIFKPSGVIVHPGAGQPDHTLVNGLLKRFGHLSPVGHPTRPGVVHRIDRDTSGLLMIAFTEQAHHHLAAQLAAHTVERRYLALAWSPPREAREGKIETSYGRHAHHRIKYTGRSNHAKRATTYWRVIDDFGPCALFELTLETGRTHQIRVHLSEAGSPLLGDILYGNRRRLDTPQRLRNLGWELGMKRQALHAATLGFEHPITRAKLSFERFFLPHERAQLKSTD